MAKEKERDEREQKGEFLIYQSEEGSTKIEVRLENENVWLPQKMIAELFGPHLKTLPFI
jgi:hypothetical protein